MDVTLVPRILEEDNYRKIRWEEAQPGDLVLYFDNGGTLSHVGMIASVPAQADHQISPTRVLSQWGFDGEYVHALTDVPPLLGRPGEVWTDRVAAP